MFRKMKLASKLAIIIAVILVVVFTGLVTASSVLSGYAIDAAVYGELETKSEHNGLQIQQIFDSADSTAKLMQTYLKKAYRLSEERPETMVIPTDPQMSALNQSVIYHRTLAPLNHTAEQYITEVARNIVISNDDILGVGVMFEPYKYQEDIRSYAFYIDTSTVEEDLKPFGEYETYSTEIYYKTAAETNKVMVTEPFEYNGVKMVTYADPILHNNELQGVIMADINIDHFDKVNATSERYASMYAIIYNSQGKVIYDSADAENVGKGIEEFVSADAERTAIRSGMAAGKGFRAEVSDRNGQKLVQFFNPISVGSETWWSMTSVKTSDVTAAVTSTNIWLTIICIGALLILIFTVIIVIRRMLKPLQRVVNAAQSISEGRLEVNVSHDSGDEIGVLSGAFQKMSETLKEIVDDVRYLLGEMSEGNFNIRTRAEASYVGDFAEFLVSLRKLHTKLSHTLNQINQSADQVSLGSDQVSDGALALSQGATEQAAAMEELASTVEEISQQVNHTAANAKMAIQKASETGDRMLQSNQQMQEMLGAMGEINAASMEIRNIIKTIEDIAFQTNILALNAAVEAARAGGAGKGFAVVAEEVRNLASKSSESSRNTALLIERCLRAVDNGKKIADDTAAALLVVVQGSKEVVSTIDEISHASNEQAYAIEQVTQGFEQISAVVQTNSATAEESAAASEELSGQARMLKELVSQFQYREDTVRETADIKELLQEREKEVELPQIPVQNRDFAFGKY